MGGAGADRITALTGGRIRNFGVCLGQVGVAVFRAGGIHILRGRVSWVIGYSVGGIHILGGCLSRVAGSSACGVYTLRGRLGRARCVLGS